MPVFSGTATGSILQVAANIPSGVLGGIITNNTSGGITLNIYVRSAAGIDIRIAPKDNSIAAGKSYYFEDGLRLLAGSSIYITTSGSTDYYITID